MPKGKVGLLTIGQSPRTDVTPSIQRILGEDLQIVERGALDSLTEKTLQSVIPDQSVTTTYISRLRDGTSIRIDKAKLLPLLQKELTEMEKSVDVVIMLCTGDFPTIKSSKPIIYPDKILSHTVQAILPAGKLGLIIPLEEQKNSLLKKWEGTNLQIQEKAASPYEPSDIEGAASLLKRQGADLIVLDCMGYDEYHKKRVVDKSGLPVILPRTLTACKALEFVTD